MNYIKDGVIVSLEKLRTLFPNTSIPEGGDMSHEGYVIHVDQPLQMTASERRSALKAEVTAMRFEHETGGVFLPDGTRIGTDRDDQNSIANAVSLIGLLGVPSVDFKTVNGWVTLTVDQLRGIAVVVGGHKQACFSAERAHHDAIDALADEDLDNYDVTLAWP